jgi:two-component sensor histidine kinase
MPTRLASGPANITKIILALLATGGVLLSLLMARVETQRYRAIERLRIGEAVDSHFSAVSDHLVTRENMATTIAALYRPPPLAAPRPLALFGPKVLALAPDLASVGWLPEVSPEQASQALKSMAASGIDSPALRGADGRPLVLQALDRPLYPIMDVVPDSARHIIGFDAADSPVRLAAIRKARENRLMAGTAPTALLQDPQARAILLFASVMDDTGAFLGVLGFGYTLDNLFRGAVAAKPNDRPFGIRVYAREGNDLLFELPLKPEQSDRSEDKTTFERISKFGGLELRFAYAVPRDLRWEGTVHGIWIGAAGLGLTGAAVLLLGFMANRAAALSQEVNSRRSAEDRLKMLIHELNHRVRNVMTVAQAIVRLSFTSGYNLSDVQKTCEGRLQALSNAMTLLTASEWRSIGLRKLMSDEIIPFAERINASGPDIFLRPRAAQTFALLLYELATNAAKHGALSVPQGQVRLTWQIDRSGEEPLFRMIWHEYGGPVVNAPSRRGFGELLVRRIAPRDVAGRSHVSYDSQGFRYELEAPLRELIDVEAAKATA